MQLRALTLDDCEPWAELLSLAFDRSGSEMVQLLHWMNTGHDLIAWGAWDGSRLVAQYCSMLTALLLPHAASLACVGLSVNLAVHPEYRGRGLVKQVARPVYAALAELGGVAGVGFSNAAGVQVDRHSTGYGYRVVGQLRPRLIWLRPTAAEPLTLTDRWPAAPVQINLPVDDHIRFATSEALIQHRFTHHPFRRYCFGVHSVEREVRGLVVYRPIRVGPFAGVSLLGAYAADVSGLLKRWASALRANGIYFVHALITPASTLRSALRAIGVDVVLPYTRSPYYLTVKPLTARTPDELLNFARWDCAGGDIL
ncbi:MAG: GNAT family N-acetyltransferase [Chloroflexi bacterium]|nr:GNAT family N-acetyltransferase [Chloroflexota bacterium]